jgi:hypothetical protein
VFVGNKGLPCGLVADIPKLCGDTKCSHTVGGYHIAHPDLTTLT